jgi:hypothetical protein
MVIGGYLINVYWWLFYYKLLLVILNYIMTIVGYSKLYYHRLSVPLLSVPLLSVLQGNCAW